MARSLAAVWETMLEGPATVASAQRRAAAKGSRWWMVGPAVAVALLAGHTVLWAAGVFKVKTADNGGKQAEVRVRPGTRKVEVKKDGFSVDGKELTFKDGDREIFTARLLPKQRVAKADVLPEKSSPPDTTTPDAPQKESDYAKQSAIRILEGHLAPVKHLLFTPEGARLASASNSNYYAPGGVNEPGNDNTVRVWNVESGQQIRKFLVNEGFGYGLHFPGFS